MTVTAASPAGPRETHGDGGGRGAAEAGLRSTGKADLRDAIGGARPHRGERRRNHRDGQ